MSAVLEQLYAHRDAVGKAHAELREEFVKALHTDPTKLIRTPGFKDAKTTVADVVADGFAGTDGDDDLAELLRIVAIAAGRGDQRARQWIAKQAAQHAALHDDFLALEMDQ
jgi:hypothetical protein